MAIWYSLLMVPFVLALVSHPEGPIVERVLGAFGCFFPFFFIQNSNPKKLGLHADQYFTFG